MEAAKKFKIVSKRNINILIVALSVIVSFKSNGQSSSKLDTCRYIYLYDTGFVFYSNPHFACSFIRTNYKSIDSLFEINKSAETYYVYNNFFKEVITQEIDTVVQTDKAIIVYRDGNILTSKFEYFRAAIVLKLCLNTGVSYKNNKDNTKSNFYLTKNGEKLYLIEKLKTNPYLKDCISVEVLK